MRTSALFFTIFAMAATAQAGDAPATSGTGGDLLSSLAKAGVTFPITYIGEVLGNPTGGRRQGAIYDGVLEAGVQLDLSQLAHWQGATFTADAYYPHGSSLTRNDVHDLNVVSNIDALHNPLLYELWLQQELFDGKLSIRVGQIPADTEFGVSAYGCALVNSAFGAPPTIALNMEAPVYPAAAPGVRVRCNPNNNWTFLAAVFDGNTGSLGSADRNGTNFNLNPSNGTLCMVEADYTVNPPACAAIDGKTAPSASRPLSGTYKVGGFLNTEDFTDTKAGGTLHGDYGVYAVADQELWHEPGAPDQGLRGFVRGGFAPPDRNMVAFDFETGLNYAGLLPGRDSDVAGLGFAYTKVSGGVLDDDGRAAGRHYEAIVELSYQAPINAHLSVQPDVQYIINPGGGDERLRNALVLGVRFTMQF